MSWRLSILGGALLVCLTSGCGATAPQSAPAPTVTVTATTTATPEPSSSAATSSDSLEPASLTDLRDQLAADGLTCDEWSVTVKNAAGSCSDLILLGYDDGSDQGGKLFQLSLNAGWTAVRDQDREDDIAFLVGDNWFARLALSDAQTLHDDLNTGGVILH